MAVFSINTLTDCLTRIAATVDGAAAVMQRLPKAEKMCADINRKLDDAKPGQTVVVMIKVVKGNPAVGYLCRTVAGRPMVMVVVEQGDTRNEFVCDKRTANLSSDDMDALLARAAAGDVDARNELVTMNLGLAYKVALNMHVADEDMFAELLAAAELAVIDAAERFDPQLGSFGTYAYMCADNACKQFLTQHSRGVHVSKRKALDELKVRAERERLAQTLGREPMMEDVADSLDWPVERVCAVYDGVATLSMDLPLGHDDDGDMTTLADSFVADDSYSPDYYLIQAEQPKELLRQIRVCIGRQMALGMAHGGDINTLSALNRKRVVERANRDTDVLRQWFGIGMDDAVDGQVIADQLGCTLERVRQIVRLWRPYVAACYVAVINGDDLTMTSAA